MAIGHGLIGGAAASAGLAGVIGGVVGKVFGVAIAAINLLIVDVWKDFIKDGIIKLLYIIALIWLYDLFISEYIQSMIIYVNWFFNMSLYRVLTYSTVQYIMSIVTVYVSFKLFVWLFFGGSVDTDLKKGTSVVAS